MAKLYTNGHDKNISGAEIAANSLVATRGRLIAIKSGYANVAVAGDRIVGLSLQDKTYDADNQTAKMEKLNYLGLDDTMEVEIAVTGTPITQASVGTLFDLDATGIVDADAVSPSQLRLTQFVSGTLGRFVVAK